jgi:DNA polymerase III subunit alpha
METVADIGLLKMDFLGLANLTILGEAVEIIRQRHGVEIDPKQIPESDDATFEMLSNGETFGVFQLESAGMRRYIRELRPHSIAELAAMVALYRPGPMQHIPTYCRAKHGEEPIRYPHADLAEVLDETYGVIVYQDQVLLIAQKFAGYTLGEADIMRKAMGKKIPEKMAAERKTFISGAVKKGYSEEDAESVFRLIEPFAGYAFNKAHAVCYGTIAYQTAWLKANYPAEYMTAVLRMAPSHPAGTAQRVAAAVAECSKLAIPVLPPDINRSDVMFSVEELDDGATGIRFGLSTIKNCGEGAVRSIVEARNSLPGDRFETFQSFCDAVDWSAVNKRVVEALIKCGAMDEMGERAALLSVLDQAISAAQGRQRAARRGQTDLFSSLGESAPTFEVTIPDVSPIAESTLLQWEKDHLGLYLSSHPLRGFTEMIRDHGLIQVAEISDDAVGEVIEIIGLVSSVRKLSTRSERTMAIVELEDLTGSIEMVFFPDLYDDSHELLEVDQALRVTARIDKRNDSLQLIAQAADRLSNDPVKSPEPVRFHEVKGTLPVSDDVSSDVELMRRIRTVLDEFPGEDQLVLRLPVNGHSIELAAGLRIDWCVDVETALAELVGRDRVEAGEKLQYPESEQTWALSA